MGNVSADGKRLWLAGRFDNVVYAIDTTTGEVTASPSAASRTAHRVAAAGPLFARPYRATCARDGACAIETFGSAGANDWNRC